MEFIFSDSGALIRTAVVGVMAYASLVVLLRVSGRRTLSKMNAFDLVVTVALGSTLATVLLNQNVSLAQGIVAFAVLIGLQFIVTWSSVRTRWVKRIVTGEPALLFYQGRFLPRALLKARVTEEEVRAAIRAAGTAAMQDVEAVVLETDGSFSVVKGLAKEGSSSLEGVQRLVTEPD